MIGKKFFMIMMLIALSMNAMAQMPKMVLKDINGKTVDTAPLSNDGKPFIISFFATWCHPCLRELTNISEVYPDWQEETGVKMILVSIDEGQNVAKVKPLVDSKGWDFQVLLDPNGDFKRAMNVQMVPSLFILDGEGNVIEAHTGYTDGSEENIIEILRKNAK